MDDDKNAPRFERWETFDRHGPMPACWLDRRTGGLLYQPRDVDPNKTPVRQVEALFGEQVDRFATDAGGPTLTLRGYGLGGPSPSGGPGGELLLPKTEARHSLTISLLPRHWLIQSEAARRTARSTTRPSPGRRLLWTFRGLW